MTEDAAKPRLTVIRWIFAILGALTMIFSGGCTLYFSLILFAYAGQGDNSEVLGLMALFGGLPFFIGLLTWWLAVKVNR
ncbi:MAG: hypothetical protein AAF441_08260 [Pseudomonadota bacterium]